MKPQNHNIKTFKWRYILVALLLILAQNDMFAQLRVGFTQRTAAATPTKVIYNIKGDFTMLGNTNLTLQSYSDTKDNNNTMVYVDVDGDPNTLNSSSATLQLSTENGAIPSCSTILFAGLYWTGKSDDNDTFSVTKGSVTKNYNKKNVSIKGPSSSAYTTLTANASNIWYPGGSDDGIFVAYKEITDYVKTNGIGQYFVADIALLEGDGPTPGYSGGWGMVVIYENYLMKSRDVTTFDGYAYVNKDNPGVIPISGFKAITAGPVNMKLGVMVSEGDRNRTGDILQMQILNTGSYLTLSHALNTTDNFYNSSILTGGNPRNPNLLNNTGIDLSMFYIPNAGNSVIANGQTTTNFKYSSSSDIFSIFGFTMAVDAYVPEPEGVIGVDAINNVTNPPQPYTVLPGQEISYTVDIKNKGTEATNSTFITIPISNTIEFVVSSISYTLIAPLTSTTGLPYYDSATRSIKWDIGSLPLPSNPNDLLGTLTFKVTATEDCATIINTSCNSEISVSGTIDGVGSISGVSFTESIFRGFDNSTGCQIPIPTAITVAFDTSSSPCFTTLAGPDQIASCGGEYVTLSATAGTVGTWSIISGPAGGGEVFSNNTSPSSQFFSPNIGVYTLRWTTGCASTTDEVIVTLENCNIIDFDGTDDNINFKNQYNLNTGSFSIETWIKSNASNGNVQTILSKRFASSLIDGYDLRVVNNFISFNWNNSNSIVSSYPISTNRWYHIAVTFNGTNYNMYIDGVLVQTATPGSNPLQNNLVDCIVGAMDEDNADAINYFSGWMDEIRFWNVSLNVNQIREMMNQEIKNDSFGNIQGATIPLNVSGLTWGNLAGYYQMNPTTDISNGHVLDKSTSTINGKLKNIYTPQPQTAPLPYMSNSDGSWNNNNTWLNGNVQSIPNTFGVDGTTSIDWNIVQTSHNIESGDRDITLLGLISSAGILTIAKPLPSPQDETNLGHSLRVSKYLEIDGIIDLVGESQLLQDTGSILDENSGGYLERDQQGTANSFNYNYWSSSVGPISGNSLTRGTGNASINAGNSISNAIMDGTICSSPQNISFNASYTWADNAYTGNKRISTYWLWKFHGTDDDYNSWSQINETSNLLPGEGFTMKGTSGDVAISNNQNYVFRGKPYNGDFTIPITLGNDRLIGNPYPSALDADEFIKDNISIGNGGRAPTNIINGALYFWDHFGEINTHVLGEYVGGYATYTLIGGAKAISNDVRINSTSSLLATKVPKRYIPVNQGFFVIAVVDNALTGIATVSGGDITFKNSQRVFATEAGGNSVFMKSSKGAKTNIIENSENISAKPKIRLMYESPKGYHRQLLVGMDENTTNSFDLGYDAPMADVNKEDMFWLFEGSKFVIQGVNNFSKDQELPLGLFVSETGLIRIKIYSLEDIHEDLELFIKDDLTKETYKINDQPFEMNLEEGEYMNRFSLVFQPRLKTLEEVSLTDGIFVFMNNASSELHIKKIVDTKIESVQLINYLGQSVQSWTEKFDERICALPIKKSSGVYIVQIQTKDGIINKKIVVD